MNVLLVCGGGMSTSILERNIEKEAQVQGIQINVDAVGVSVALERLQAYDVILVAPQVRHCLPQLNKVADNHGVAIELIDMKSYGLMRGDLVLSQAIQLFQQKKNV